MKREKKSDDKFPIKKIQLADFDRVGRVRGNKLIFNFGLRSNKEKSENNSDSPLDKLCLAFTKHVFQTAINCTGVNKS